MGFGVSFLPSDQNSPNNQNPLGNAGGAPPLQQAIQLLSLRLPHVVGSQGLAPGPLLQSPGGMGLAEILKQLFGQGQPATSLPGGGTLPMPAFHPGATPPPPPGPPTFGQPGTQDLPKPPGGYPPGQGLPPGTFHPGGYDQGPSPMAPTGPSNRDWLTPQKNY